MHEKAYGVYISDHRALRHNSPNIPWQACHLTIYQSVDSAGVAGCVPPRTLFSWEREAAGTKECFHKLGLSSKGISTKEEKASRLAAKRTHPTQI